MGIILQLPNFGIFKSAIVKMKQNSSVLMNTKWYSYFTIIGRGWAKYHDLSVTSRSMISRSRRMRQIIDLRDTDKSRYFVIIDHGVCFFNEYPREARQSAIFTQERSQEGESTVSFTHVQNIICSQAQLDGIAHEHTIICRQLFAGHVVGSRPMKRKKNLLRMIKWFIYYVDT